MALFNKQTRTHQRTSEKIPADPKDLRDPDRTKITDELLDDIDSVLEENAQAFVDSFVQKGGQ